MSITIIAAVGRNGVIGNGNAIPWRLPDDQARFKQVTMGHTLVMGRKTYESIGRPLPGRVTIVVTRQPRWAAAGAAGTDVTVAHSFAEAISIAEADREVFVAGGAELYRLALPVADRMLLTEVDEEPPGDVFFPPYDPADWREVSREPHEGFTFVTYVRR